MNIHELVKKLEDNNVRSAWYSLYEGRMKPDAWTIIEDHNRWEVFYVDDRGQQHENTEFYNFSDAYDFLWAKLEKLIQIYGTVKG